MKKITSIGSMLLLLLSLATCTKQVEIDNSPYGNMEALWTMLDERYCFFDYKQVNWDSVHDVFLDRVRPGMSNEALLVLMDEMLDLLQDGHVNVYATFNSARYWQWFEDYPYNYNSQIIDKYLGTDYYISGSMKYRVLDDNIGYIYNGSFVNPVSGVNMDHILNRLSMCNGIIIDVRNNGGGDLSYAQTVAAAFAKKKVLTSYIRHKTGKGHNDFSDYYPVYIYPKSDPFFNFYKPIVVLHNRRTFSAGNDFVNVMRQLPNVTTIGDRTGGGSGLPFSSILPNGWSVRFSTSPTFNPQKEHIEFGIMPDIEAHMSDEEMARGVDTIIETARSFINNQ